jgi:cation diffusion facilitator CzcD-associated flavoprotein CzcO
MPVSRNFHPWPFPSSDTPDDAKLQMPLPPLLSAVARIVDVIGGGNSAGQAAVFLGQTAKRVHMLVRPSGLAESMSRYLILEQTPTITLRTNTEIVALEGGAILRGSIGGTIRPGPSKPRKRVASAVGEGSIAVAFVHQALHE